MRKRALKLFSTAVIALAVALAGLWFAAKPNTPDGFYAWQKVPEASGKLLKVEAYELDVPVGARASRILYETTRHDGRPAIASAIVMVPMSDLSPRPVIAWAHGTTGIAPGCAPSVTKPFANVPAVKELVFEGWAYVAADYVGLGTEGGHAYLVGEEAARNLLDAVRAARQMPDFNLDNNIVVWGHSQGGNTALWTGMIAPSYAPDVKVSGIAALAPASDLRNVLKSAQSGLFGKIVSAYLIKSYVATYPDVQAEALVNGWSGLIVDDLASRCVADWRALFSVAQTFLLPASGVFLGDPLAGPLGKRLAENSPNGPFAAPVFLAQGAIDDLIVEPVQSAFVTARCAENQNIDYRVFPGRDHISLVAADSPLAGDLVAWTKDRFAQKPATASCQ